MRTCAGDESQMYDITHRLGQWERKWDLRKVERKESHKTSAVRQNRGKEKAQRGQIQEQAMFSDAWVDGLGSLRVVLRDMAIAISS